MEPEQLYGRWCDHKTAPQQAGPFKDSLFFTVSQFKNVGRFEIKYRYLYITMQKCKFE